jgi:hypothetical protein
MNILIQIQPPNWADILQGIGSIIGVPGAIAAFVLLFLKDKHKQEQLDSLKEIASKIEGQNEILIESNDLAAAQIEVLRKMFLNPVGDGYNKLAEIEEKKLKLSVKPNLKSNSQSYRMDELWVDINNYGELAIIDSVEFDTVTFYPMNTIKVGYELVKDSQIRIGLKSKDGANTNYKNYVIEIFYHDKLNNKFKLRIERDVPSGLFGFQQLEL